jgi:hypothetical protein
MVLHTHVSPEEQTIGPLVASVQRRNLQHFMFAQISAYFVQILAFLCFVQHEQILTCKKGRVMAQAVCSWSLTADARIRARFSLYGICRMVLGQVYLNP